MIRDRLMKDTLHSPREMTLPLIRDQKPIDTLPDDQFLNDLHLFLAEKSGAIGCLLLFLFP